MAADFKTFLTTYALYLVVCTVILLFFGIFRRSKVAYKFYNPARFDETRAKRRPKPLPPSLFGWIREISRYGQADLVIVAGYDAACFLRVLAFGTELFSFLAVWCLLVVLPTNISGNQVNVLIGKNNVPTSEFTYWVPPSPPPYPPGEKPPPSSGPPQMIKAPDFYDTNIPPAPAGLQWWKYKAGVPPLPDPATIFNGSKEYRDYGWKYDSGYSANDYIFTNLDVTSMTNIGQNDSRLWVHFLSTWVISLYLWKLLWRYNKDAVTMRIQFLMESKRRVEACTVLVRDIPGIYYGSVADRIERTALRFLPAVVKRRIVQYGGKTLENVGRGVDATVTNISQVVLPDGTVSTPPNMGAPTPARRPDTDVPTAPGTQEEIGPGESAPGALPTELAAEEAAVRSHAEGLSTAEFVKEQFNAVFENQVEQVQVCYNTRALDKLVGEYSGILLKLQDELDDYISLDKRRKTIKRRKMTVVGLQYGQWGVDKYGSSPTRVDTLSFYPQRLKALLEEIRQAQNGLGFRAQNGCLPPNEQAMPAAFVTFSKRKCQIDAAGGMFHHDRSAWMIDPAPGPEEIIWKNLGWRKWERAIRFTMIWTIFFVIVIFYIPFVSAVQGLLQLDKLQQLPVVRQLTALPLVSSLVQAFLPSLVLRIFLVVLPYLLSYMGHMEGLVSFSAVQFSVVKKLFTFQFLTVFLTSLIAGTILRQLQEFLQNPSSLVSSLGAAAPQTATFFMLYLLLTGLIAKPIQFLRFPGLLLLHFQTWRAHTERAKARLWEQQYVDYGWEVPDCCIAILLGLVFCVIQPLMTPIALSYFLVNSILYKYQLIYVHKPQFESGGMVWTQVFDHVVIAALAFQVIMLGLLFLQGGLLPLLLLLPLPFMFLAMWAGASDLFRRPLKLLSQKAAANIDRLQRDALSPEEVSEAESYQHPAFKIDEGELTKLLEEAEKAEELLAMPDYSPGLLAMSLGEREKDIEEGEEGSRSSSMREVLLPQRAD